jgi:hypothetical protein
LWELVYADGWMYQYEGYKRSAIKKNCGWYIRIANVLDV